MTVIVLFPFQINKENNFANGHPEIQLVVRKHSKISKPSAMYSLLNSTPLFSKGFCNLSKPQPLDSRRKSRRKLEQG